jgi:hypothetical protein
MPQRRSIVFGSIFAAGLMVIGWLEYYPSSEMFAVLGMPGPRANRGRQCGGFYRQLPLIRTRTRSLVWRMPTRSLACRGSVFFTPTSIHLEEVNLDMLSRRFLRADRVWSVPDSAKWRAQQDSVATAMKRFGGHEIICAKDPYLQERGYPQRHWKFPKFYVRLLASHWDRGRPASQWTLQLQGTPTAPDECVRDPWRTPPLSQM